MTEETHANRFRRIVRLRRGRSQTSEETDSQEPSSSEEAHEQESAASDTSSKSAKASKKRRTSRKIRRYEVPIGTDGGTQTVLRFKPLGFWKMFAEAKLVLDSDDKLAFQTARLLEDVRRRNARFLYRADAVPSGSRASGDNTRRNPLGSRERPSGRLGRGCGESSLRRA